jgi:hypothetical protein
MSTKRDIATILNLSALPAHTHISWKFPLKIKLGHFIYEDNSTIWRWAPKQQYNNFYSHALSPFQHFVNHETDAEIRGCKLQASHLFYPPLRIQIESHWYANSDYTLENYRSIAFPLTTYVCMLWNVGWNFLHFSLYSLTKYLLIKEKF